MSGRRGYIVATMPELPEVETVRRGLAPILVGRRLRGVTIRRTDLRFPLPRDFARQVSGARVDAFERRAKYLIARLDNGAAWVTHLGMTGRFTARRAAALERPLGEFYYAAPPDPVHTHVSFETDAGDVIEFNDARRFGYMDVIPLDGLFAHKWFAKLGPEPLGPGFDGAHLARALKNKAVSIKAALLDQTIVAGLGNIYVNEALFRAGIHPKRAAGRIGGGRLDRLAEAARAVLDEAIAAGGSTLRDYAAADGARGAFQQRFRVYDRAGLACVLCGGQIRRAVQSGRSSFYCPHCQR